MLRLWVLLERDWWSESQSLSESKIVSEQKAFVSRSLKQAEFCLSHGAWSEQIVPVGRSPAP